METTTINIKGVQYIVEVKLEDDGTSELHLTEACNHPESDRDLCQHYIYDFREVIA